jgi:hypothetical protein
MINRGSREVLTWSIKMEKLNSIFGILSDHMHYPTRSAHAPQWPIVFPGMLDKSTSVEGLHGRISAREVGFRVLAGEKKDMRSVLWIQVPVT